MGARRSVQACTDIAKCFCEGTQCAVACQSRLHDAEFVNRLLFLCGVRMGARRSVQACTEAAKCFCEGTQCAVCLQKQAS